MQGILHILVREDILQQAVHQRLFYVRVMEDPVDDCLFDKRTVRASRLEVKFLKFAAEVTKSEA